MDIKGKTIIVTGSSSGIGKDIALAFAQKGGNIVITCKNNKQGAEGTIKELESYKVKTMLFIGDLSDEDVVKDLFKKVLNKFSSIDVLINNAGEAIIAPFLEGDLEYWDSNIKNNLYTTIFCSREAIKIMLKQKDGGKIINAASINGMEHMGRPDTEAYSIAKAGVINLTKTIAKAYAPKILINAVCPGKTKTRHYDKFDKQYLDKLTETIPVKRFLTPSEVASTYIHIAENDGICGEVIVIDGGLSLKQY